MESSLILYNRTQQLLTKLNLHDIGWRFRAKVTVLGKFTLGHIKICIDVIFHY